MFKLNSFIKTKLGIIQYVKWNPDITLFCRPGYKSVKSGKTLNAGNHYRYYKIENQLFKYCGELNVL